MIKKEIPKKPNKVHRAVLLPEVTLQHVNAVSFIHRALQWFRRIFSNLQSSQSSLQTLQIHWAGF